MLRILRFSSLPIVDGKIVLSLKPVAKIGDAEYTTIQDAINAAQNGDTVVLLNDVYNQ